MIERAGSFAASQTDASPHDYKRMLEHPFVTATADGTLAPERFDVWIQQDRYFVEGLMRPVGALARLAPSDEEREGFLSGIAALEQELELFGRHASERGIRLDVVRMPVCADYIEYLDLCVQRGYPQGLAAYHAVELAYLDAWTGVRDRVGDPGPYADWIENWTSAPFRAYVDWLGGRLDAVAMGLDGEQRQRLREVFADVVRYEIAFWDACWEA